MTVKVVAHVNPEVGHFPNANESVCPHCEPLKIIITHAIYMYVYYIRYEIKEGEAVSGLHDGCENDTMNLVKEMRAEAQTAS